MDPERRAMLFEELGEEKAQELLDMPLDKRLRIAQFLCDSANKPDSGMRFTVTLVSGH